MSERFFSLTLAQRLFLLITLLIISGVIIRNVIEYQNLEEDAETAAYREAKQLQEYSHSVQNVYQKQFDESGIELSAQTIGFLPAHATSKISDDFTSRSSQDIVIRNVADDARNPLNQAKPYEHRAIDYFKAHPRRSELMEKIDLDGEESFFYAAPLKIQSYCLLCHGERNDAPPFIRNNYTRGYGYQVGEVRGITSITIPKSYLIRDAKALYWNRIIPSSAIALLIIFLIYAIVRQGTRKEAKLIHRFRRLSFTDQLTGLYNRRKIDEFINEHHHLFERYKDPYSLIMIDIDFFKEVNDLHGHARGDEVLQTIAAILRKNIRTTDHISRWGGEEFLILCPKTFLSEALFLAEKLRKSVETHAFEGIGVKTISLGVAEVEVGDAIKDVLNRADTALYLAKEKGRNRTES